MEVSAASRRVALASVGVLLAPWASVANNLRATGRPTSRRICGPKGRLRQHFLPTPRILAREVAMERAREAATTAATVRAAGAAIGIQAKEVATVRAREVVTTAATARAAGAAIGIQ